MSPLFILLLILLLCGGCWSFTRSDVKLWAVIFGLILYGWVAFFALAMAAAAWGGLGVLGALVAIICLPLAIIGAVTNPNEQTDTAPAVRTSPPVTPIVPRPRYETYDAKAWDDYLAQRDAEQVHRHARRGFLS